MVSRILRTPSFVLGLLGLLLTMHIIASFGGLYPSPDPTLREFRIDRLFHAVGGFWIAALFFFYAMKKREIFDAGQHPMFAFLAALALTALAGVFWEFFEFALDLTFAGSSSYAPQQGGISDTMFDFVFDLLGAGVAATLYILAFRQK